jgi:hypothetical protein
MIKTAMTEKNDVQDAMFGVTKENAYEDKSEAAVLAMAMMEPRPVRRRSPLTAYEELPLPTCRKRQAMRLIKLNEVI